jgi:Periplasmic component of the Tol biopolymer transport system
VVFARDDVVPPGPPCSGSYAQHLFTIKLDGSGLRRPTTGLPCPQDREPAWSPDGSRIAYVSDDGLHVVRADGSGDTHLPDRHRYDRTVRGADPHTPIWSPDGQRLAFVRAITTDDSSGLWITDLAGNERRVEPRTYRDPAWSPDGTAIAYVATAPENTFVADIWRVSPDGSARRALTHGPYYDPKTNHYSETDPVPEQNVNPRWTRDGRIVFFSNRGYTGQGPHPAFLYVMDAKGKNVVKLAHQIPG